MSAFRALDAIPPQRLRPGLRARSIHGGLMTMTVFEVEPGAEVPAHEHANEQLGLLVEGALSYRVGSETRTLVPGDTWCIAPHVDHHVRAGDAGAVFVEIFSPARDEWRSLESGLPEPPRWPPTRSG